MPSRSMRVKREPVVLDDNDEDLLDTRRQPSTTTNMPVRGGSVVSVGVPNGTDIDMTDNSETLTNGHGSSNGTNVNGHSTSNGTYSNHNVNGNRSDTAGVHALGGHSRQLIQVIQMLEALNIDATLPSLPKFVVIGDQSAGKSSIIEAVSDITLPRSAGTCTRCPFKITTTAKDGQDWTCTVSLHIKYTFSPHTRATKDGEIFNGWAENKDLLILPFASVTNKGQLEVILRRAQLALLNPDKNHTSFFNCPVDYDSQDDQKVGFSPNVISLEIAAPGLPELSFYDLPGAINTLGDESEQHLVDFVEKLIKSYIQEDKARILLACAANQDLETSTTFRYLRECQASARAMGVLTKPDLIELTPARLAYVQNLLQGKKGHKVGDGWFVTRQLSQKELDQQTGYSRARDLEKEFFSADPWATDLVDHTHRFGIPNLQTALSQKLVQHILDDLPEIIDRVQTRLSDIDAQLAMFPEQAVAPGMSVAIDIDKVKSKLLEQLNADSTRSVMRKQYREIFRNLSKKLQSLKPKVSMSTPGYQKPSISLDSSEEDESPSKSRRMNGGGRAMSVNNTPNRSSRPPRRTPASSHSSQDSEGFAVFRLADVRARFDAAPGADIESQSDGSVVRGLILDTLVGWPAATDGAIKNVRRVFKDMLDQTIADALAQRQKTQLYEKVGEITHALFDELFKKVEEFLYQLIASETHRPITYNVNLKPQKAAHNAEYRKLRNEQRVQEHYEILEAQGFKMISKQEQKKKAADAAWMATTLGADEYDRELQELATPIAYYEIASTQLVDGMAKMFETGLMHAYETRIHRKLLEDLRTTDADYCAQLLAEDPERERQRVELVAEKSKLEHALSELKGLPATHLAN